MDKHVRKCIKCAQRRLKPQFGKAVDETVAVHAAYGLAMVVAIGDQHHGAGGGTCGQYSVAQKEIHHESLMK